MKFLNKSQMAMPKLAEIKGFVELLDRLVASDDVKLSLKGLQNNIEEISRKLSNFEVQNLSMKGAEEVVDLHNKILVDVVVDKVNSDLGTTGNGTNFTAEGALGFHRVVSIKGTADPIPSPRVGAPQDLVADKSPALVKQKAGFGLEQIYKNANHVPSYLDSAVKNFVGNSSKGSFSGTASDHPNFVTTNNGSEITGERAPRLRRVVSTEGKDLIPPPLVRQRAGGSANEMGALGFTTTQKSIGTLSSNKNEMPGFQKQNAGHGNVENIRYSASVTEQLMAPF